MPSQFRSSLLNAICNMDDELIAVWQQSTLELVFFNGTHRQVFGERACGKVNFYESASLVLNEPPRKEALDLILSRLETEENLSQELMFRDCNGRLFLGLLRLAVFEDGGKKYILQRIIDINELHEAIESLKLEKHRFEALFQFASMAIIVAGKDGVIRMANQYAHTLFGYKTSLAGKMVEDLIPSRFREKHVRERQGYNKHPLNRTMGLGYNLFGQRSDGTEFPVEVSLGHYMINEDTYTIAYIVDITNRKQIEETMLSQKTELERINTEVEQLNDELEAKVESRTRELKETMEQLEHSKLDLEEALNKEKELSDLKSRFVSMASHEFRTPLSTILSSASLVAKYTKTEEQDRRDKHIQRIRSAVSNLTDILNEFLSIGRIEEGRVQTNFSHFNIREQIQLVSSEMQPIMRPGQKIIYEHQGQASVYLDLSLMRNVMINLISNAIKFSAEHSVINIRSEVNEKTILISIQDYGLGIPEDDKKHLFERFFRAKNVTNIQGTGLGLHIVSRYVELMNGTITVDSELEKGTKFNIQFPYEQNSVDRG